MRVVFVHDSAIHANLKKIIDKSSQKRSKIIYLCDAKKCPYSLMDRISDSGSEGCGSIPHGGTKFFHKSVVGLLIGYIFACTKRPVQFEVASM